MAKPVWDSIEKTMVTRFGPKNKYWENPMAQKIASFLWFEKYQKTHFKSKRGQILTFWQKFSLNLFLWIQKSVKKSILILPIIKKRSRKGNLPLTPLLKFFEYFFY